ncbi:HK97-gp10 family putative phage morphogenesis protein [Methylobacillus flagellatus]|uniref:HK97-gp10 family putative phage morphogenesis protein n=1 Tax=Methylobacillus flagellatus TaxID=405 RepID=UPI0010F51F8F|nr:HK97-gp10 family putative phage morphogenesis protein [Methylobacillus flagellatus]
MTTKVEGLTSLQKAFEQVKEDMTLSLSRRMAASGANQIKRRAVANAEKLGLRKSGALISNIAIKRERTPEGVAQYNVGVRHGRELGRKYRQLEVGKSGRVRTTYKNNPFYWSYLEFGRNIVARASGVKGTGSTTYTQFLRNGRIATRTKKYGLDGLVNRRRQATGRVEATPFLQPALDNQDEVIAEMVKPLNRYLKRNKL